MPLQTNKKRKKENKTDNHTLDEWIEISPYKRIEQSPDEEIVLRDDRVLQLLRIEGTGASAVSYEELQLIINRFYTFISKNNANYSIEVTNVPLNLQKQIRYKKKRLAALERSHPQNEREEAQLKITRMILENKIKKFRKMETELTNTEYVLYLFDEDARQLSVNTQSFIHLAQAYRFNIKRLSRVEKETILFQLNNMNTKL